MNTQSLPSIFNFQQHQLRGIVIEQQPWFAAKDICIMLDIGDASQAALHLDDDEKQNLVIQGLGEKQGRRTLCVNESGAWALVIRSRKPEAKAIRKWLTSEVLPALHRTGTYTKPGKEERATPRPSPLNPRSTREEQEQRQLPAGVLDARHVPTTTVGLRKGRVRMVSIEGKQWYCTTDVLRCIGLTGRNGTNVSKQMPADHCTMVQLYGISLPCWAVTETGIRIMLGARGMLHSQLNLNLD